MRRRKITDLIAWNTSMGARRNPGTEVWVSKYLKRHRRLIDSVMPVGRRLGCGSYGCAFTVSVPFAYTLKITSDRMEGAMMRFVELARRKRGKDWLPGVVDVLGVWQGPSATPDWSEDKRNVYVIVREDVRPLSPDDLNSEDAKESSTGRRSELLDAVNNLMDTYEAAQKAQGAQSARAFRSAVIEFARGTARVAKSWPMVGGALKDLFLEDGIMLADVHWGNIGFTLPRKPGVARAHIPRSAGDAVIFDVGATEATFPKGLDPSRIPRLTPGSDPFRPL